MFIYHVLIYPPSLSLIRELRQFTLSNITGIVLQSFSVSCCFFFLGCFNHVYSSLSPCLYYGYIFWLVMIDSPLSVPIMKWILFFVIVWPNGHIAIYVLKGIFNFQQPKWTLILRESVNHVTEQQGEGKGANAGWLLKGRKGVENTSSKIFSANCWGFSRQWSLQHEYSTRSYTISFFRGN